MSKDNIIPFRTPIKPDITLGRPLARLRSLNYEAILYREHHIELVDVQNMMALIAGDFSKENRRMWRTLKRAHEHSLEIFEVVSKGYIEDYNGRDN